MLRRLIASTPPAVGTVVGLVGEAPQAAASSDEATMTVAAQRRVSVVFDCTVTSRWAPFEGHASTCIWHEQPKCDTRDGRNFGEKPSALPAAGGVQAEVGLQQQLAALFCGGRHRGAEAG